MKSFFGNVFVRMNEGRLTPELMYTPASAFLQFFGCTQEFEGLVGWIQSNFFCVGMIAILPLPKRGFSWSPLQ